MSNSSISRKGWASRCRRGRNSALMSCMSGLTRSVIRTRRSRPRRRRQHGSNRGSLSFESAAVLICHVLARTTPSRAPPSCRPGTHHLHRSRGQADPLGVSPIGREALIPAMFCRKQAARRERPALYTTTNVCLRRRRALLGFLLVSGLGLRGKREDSCLLPFTEPRQK